MGRLATRRLGGLGARVSGLAAPGWRGLRRDGRLSARTSGRRSLWGARRLGARMTGLAAPSRRGFGRADALGTRVTRLAT